MHANKFACITFYLKRICVIDIWIFLGSHRYVWLQYRLECPQVFFYKSRFRAPFFAYLFIFIFFFFAWGYKTRVKYILNLSTCLRPNFKNTVWEKKTFSFSFFTVNLFFFVLFNFWEKKNSKYCKLFFSRPFNPSYHSDRVIPKGSFDILKCTSWRIMRFLTQILLAVGPRPSRDVPGCPHFKKIK